MPLPRTKQSDNSNMEVVVQEVTFKPGRGDTTTVTQATNRTTAVTINASVGQITCNNTSLAAGAEAKFTVNNDRVTAKSVIVANMASGQTADTSVVDVVAVANGSFVLQLTNLNAATADTGAGVINFVVLGGQ